MREVFKALEDFLEAVEPLTSAYKEATLTSIIYAAMGQFTRGDGRVGFSPSDLRNISDDDFINLLKKLEKHVRVQSQAR